MYHSRILTPQHHCTWNNSHLPPAFTHFAAALSTPSHPQQAAFGQQVFFILPNIRFPVPCFFFFPKLCFIFTDDRPGKVFTLGTLPLWRLYRLKHLSFLSLSIRAADWRHLPKKQNRREQTKDYEFALHPRFYGKRAQCTTHTYAALHTGTGRPCACAAPPPAAPRAQARRPPALAPGRRVERRPAAGACAAPIRAPPGGRARCIVGRRRLLSRRRAVVNPPGRSQQCRAASPPTPHHPPPFLHPPPPRPPPPPHIHTLPPPFLLLPPARWFKGAAARSGGGEDHAELLCGSQLHPQEHPVRPGLLPLPPGPGQVRHPPPPLPPRRVPPQEGWVGGGGGGALPSPLLRPLRSAALRCAWGGTAAGRRFPPSFPPFPRAPSPRLLT